MKEVELEVQALLLNCRHHAYLGASLLWHATTPVHGYLWAFLTRFRCQLSTTLVSLVRGGVVPFLRNGDQATSVPHQRASTRSENNWKNWYTNVEALHDVKDQQSTVMFCSLVRSCTLPISWGAAQSKLSITLMGTVVLLVVAVMGLSSTSTTKLHQYVRTNKYCQHSPS